MPNNTITAARVPFLNPNTPLIAREWYLFLYSLYVLTGSGDNETTLVDLQVGPSDEALTSRLYELEKSVQALEVAPSTSEILSLLTGPLPLSRGGTSANLTAVNGGIPYSTASAIAILAAGSSGNLLTSGGAGAPTWSTPTSTATNSAVCVRDGSAGLAVAALTATTGLFGGVVSLKVGTSSSNGKAGGCIFNHYTDSGNSTTAETDLYTNSLVANTFGTNGDKVTAEYGGTFVSSATATRQMKIYFAGTVILDTGALSISASASWGINVLIIRVSSTVVRYSVSLQTAGASLAVYNAVGELTGLTLSGANVLKVTGQAAGVGAATNDIVAKLGMVSWLSAA